MKSLRNVTLFLFGALLLSVATPSCTADDSAADALPVAGRGGAGGVAGGGAGRTGGRGGTASSMSGAGGTGGAETHGDAGTRTTTTDAGAAGDEQATSGGTGNAVGQAGEGAASGEGGETSNGGGSGTGTAGNGGSAGSDPCTAITGFGDLETYVGVYSSTYRAPVVPNIDSSDVEDFVWFSVIADLGGDEVGTFELGTGIDASWGTCARCLLVRQDDGTKSYFATAGTLTFDSSSLQTEGHPKGTLRDVTLREVAGDWLSDTSFIRGGGCLTIANADLLVNAPPEPPHPPGWTCDYAAYGDGTCDCGCGALDSDCADSAVADCQRCNCGNTDCSLVNATENYLCDEVWFPPCTAITGLGQLSVDRIYAPALVSFSAPVLPNLGSATEEDAIYLEVHSDEVGTFELGTGIDDNLETCERCVYVAEDWGATYYLATEGTLTFDSNSRQIDGYPLGTLRNVTLRQITYNSTFHSTVVRGGACLTVADGDALVNAAPPP